MGLFSGLGVGLSFVFGCIVLGFVAELYYLLWWKKRFTNNLETENHPTKPPTKLFSLFRYKKHNTLNKNNTQELPTSIFNNSYTEQDNNNSPLKCLGEEAVDLELMRLHNLCGPPRFLSTINEEAKEDLESDDGKSKGDRSRKGSRSKSFSDVIVALDNPSLDSFSQHGFKFNPFFDSSSPPPKLKFLRDAEDKLMRRLMEETERRALKNGGCVENYVSKDDVNSTQEKDGSFIALVVGKRKESVFNHQLPQHHSTPSQVLPLDSSPSVFTPLDNKSIVE